MKFLRKGRVVLPFLICGKTTTLQANGLKDPQAMKGVRNSLCYNKSVDS